GRVGDAAYAEWLAHPPISVYVTGGGRLWVTPLASVVGALALVGLAGIEGAGVSFIVALAIVVHATTVLALQQVIAVPAQLVSESLPSPTSLATLMPAVEDGTWLARLFGAIDIFGIWWVALIAIGLAAATRRSTLASVGSVVAGQFAIRAL